MVGVVPEIGRARLLLELTETGTRLFDTQVAARITRAARDISKVLREIAPSTPACRVDAGSARLPALLHLHLPWQSLYFLPLPQ